MLPFCKILEIPFHSTDDVSSAYPTSTHKVPFCHKISQKFIIPAGYLFSNLAIATSRVAHKKLGGESNRFGVNVVGIIQAQ